MRRQHCDYFLFTGVSRNFPRSSPCFPQTAPCRLNPLVCNAVPLLDHKVGVKGCSAKHPVLDVNRRGSPLFNATPSQVSGECLIGTIMRSERSGNEHEATQSNQSSLWNKKSERLSIELMHLSEIKRGSTTVFSYQELMVASQAPARI